MYRFLALVTALLLMFSAVPASAGAEAPLNIVVSAFPIYDWVRNVLGERAAQVKLTLLQDEGVDLHNYQPGSRDLAALAEADLFVYIGGQSDAWVADAIRAAQNRRLVSVSLMEVPGMTVKSEKVVEGMQEDEHAHEHEEEEEADHDDHDEHDHDHEHEHSEPDEHIWLSLRNAQTAVSFLSDMLGELDRENAALYAQNSEKYRAALRALDEDYAAAVSEKKEPVVLFADRFPFRYLMDDYGIAYYAAFSGCAAETEASFATVAFLAGKVNDLSLPAVLAIDGSDQKVARTVIENSGRQLLLLTMHSMQTVTRQDIEAGAEYLSIMQNNLDVLAQAL